MGINKIYIFAFFRLKSAPILLRTFSNIFQVVTQKKFRKIFTTCFIQNENTIYVCSRLAVLQFNFLMLRIRKLNCAAASPLRKKFAEISMSNFFLKPTLRKHFTCRLASILLDVVFFAKSLLLLLQNQSKVEFGNRTAVALTGPTGGLT